jgi:hypothetical protein
LQIFAVGRDEAHFEAIHACAQHILAMLAWVLRSSAEARGYIRLCGTLPFPPFADIQVHSGYSAVKYYMRREMKKALSLRILFIESKGDRQTAQS